MNEKTPVIFRIFEGQVIALFVNESADIYAFNCMSYMRLGQHSSACPYTVIENSVPAKKDDYEGLKQELESIGYNLKIRKRHTWNDVEKRRSQVAKIRKEG